MMKLMKHLCICIVALNSVAAAAQTASLQKLCEGLDIDRQAFLSGPEVKAQREKCSRQKNDYGTILDQHQVFSFSPNSNEEIRVFLDCRNKNDVKLVPVLENYDDTIYDEEMLCSHTEKFQLGTVNSFEIEAEEMADIGVSLVGVEYKVDLSVGNRNLKASARVSFISGMYTICVVKAKGDFEPEMSCYVGPRTDENEVQAQDKEGGDVVLFAQAPIRPLVPDRVLENNTADTCRLSVNGKRSDCSENEFRFSLGMYLPLLTINGSGPEVELLKALQGHPNYEKYKDTVTSYLGSNMGKVQLEGFSMSIHEQVIKNLPALNKSAIH